MKKLTDTIAIRDAHLRAKIDEMVARSGVKLSEIVRAALEVGLPIIERDGIRRTFTSTAPPASHKPDASHDPVLAAMLREMEAEVAPIIARIKGAGRPQSAKNVQKSFTTK